MISHTWSKLKNNIPDIFSIYIKNIYTILFTLFFPKGVFKKINFLNISFLIKVKPKNGTVDNVILWEGVLDGDHLKKIKENLSEGDIFIDIGANIGQYSLFASKCVGDRGKVFAFEPVKDIFDQFIESINKNNIHNIIAYRKGVGEKRGCIYINKQKGNAGGSTFVDLGWKKDTEKEKIELISLDDFLKEEKAINFVKIGVEGFEYEVLKGMINIIKKIKPKILIEYSPHIYKLHNKNNSELIIDFLLENNYNIIDIGNEKTVLNSNYYKENNIGMTNLLCI